MNILEIDFLVPQIEEYFKSILDRNNLVIEVSSDKTKIYLKNSNYSIMIYGEGWHGFALDIKLINEKSNEEYRLHQLIEKKRIKGSLLTKEEKEVLKKMPEGHNSQLLDFSFSIQHLEKYINEEFGFVPE